MPSMQPYLFYGAKGAAILIIIVLGFISYLVRQWLKSLFARKLTPDSGDQLPLSSVSVWFLQLFKNIDFEPLFVPPLHRVYKYAIDHHAEMEMVPAGHAAGAA